MHMRLSEILHINIQSSIELSYFSPTYVFERGAVYLSYFYFCVISHNCKNLHFQILYDIRKNLFIHQMVIQREKRACSNNIFHILIIILPFCLLFILFTFIVIKSQSCCSFCISQSSIFRLQHPL